MSDENKIIRVAQVIGPAVNGGTEAYAKNYYMHIDRTKVQFDFLVENESKIINKSDVEALGGHIVIIPSYRNPLNYVQTLTKIFKENKYDIVHSNMNTLSYFTLKAAKRAGIKVRIAHSHSTSNPKEFTRNMIKNTLKPFSKKYATDYFACSELAGRYLFGDKTFDKGLVTVINNGIDINKFKYNEEYNISIRKELNIDPNTKVIGHVGRFVHQKNHFYLIDIFNEIHKLDSNTKLLLLGDGPLKEEVETKVHTLGLDDSVIFAGTKQDIYKYYSVMNLFIFPSLYEGLGLTGVEAQVSGLYCLVSSNITRELATTANIEFMDIKDSPQAWASRAIEVLSNNTIDRSMTYKEIEGTKFDIDNEANKLVGYYQDMMKRYD